MHKCFLSALFSIAKHKVLQLCYWIIMQNIETFLLKISSPQRRFILPSLQTYNGAINGTPIGTWIFHSIFELGSATWRQWVWPNCGNISKVSRYLPTYLISLGGPAGWVRRRVGRVGTYPVYGVLREGFSFTRTTPQADSGGRDGSSLLSWNGKLKYPVIRKLVGACLALNNI